MKTSSKKPNDLTPSLKKISQLLNEAKFNPKQPGPMNVVAASSGPSYLESRSLEFIMEAQQHRGDAKHLAGFIQANNLDIDKERFKKSLDHYKYKMIRAIQCLALAIAKVENGEF